jgi:hypothetical protein
METYSVSWRLQRIRTEYAYVRVPVTDEVIKVDEKGTGRIDADKMAQRALELAQSPAVEWYPEDQRVQLHPMQKAPDPGEKWL